MTDKEKSINIDALKKHCNKIRHNCYKCEHKKTFCPIIKEEKAEIKLEGGKKK